MAFYLKTRIINGIVTITYNFLFKGSLLYKKLLFCVAVIAVSTNTLQGMRKNNSEVPKKNSPFTSKFPNIKLPLGIKAALKGGKNGTISAFLVALPSVGLLDGSLKEKLAIPFLSGIAGGIFGTIAGGLSTLLPTGFEKHWLMNPTTVKFQARGVGIGIGSMVGLAALGLCYSANKSGSFNIFNP